MPTQRILIVEDDQNIAQLVRYNLEKAGFSCLVTITGEEALEYLQKEAVDAVILDIMLPKMDGLETCKLIRQESSHVNTPIIMLTAKGEEIDRVVGFELGADDYLVKPFSPRELILRVKALLRRAQHKDKTESKEIIRTGDLMIDIPRHKVLVGERAVKLTPMEFKLLLTLVQRKGRVQTRDTLLDDVWSFDSAVTTRTIDTHIRRLREKLGRAGKMIDTVRGHGYRLVDEEED